MRGPTPRCRACYSCDPSQVLDFLRIPNLLQLGLILSLQDLPSSLLYMPSCLAFGGRTKSEYSGATSRGWGHQRLFVWRFQQDITFSLFVLDYTIKCPYLRVSIMKTSSCLLTKFNWSISNLPRSEGGRVVLWLGLEANFAIQTIGQQTEMSIASFSRPTSFPQQTNKRTYFLNTSSYIPTSLPQLLSDRAQVQPSLFLYVKRFTHAHTCRKLWSRNQLNISVCLEKKPDVLAVKCVSIFENKA